MDNTILSTGPLPFDTRSTLNPGQSSASMPETGQGETKKSLEKGKYPPKYSDDFDGFDYLGADYFEVDVSDTFSNLESPQPKAPLNLPEETSRPSSSLWEKILQISQILPELPLSNAGSNIKWPTTVQRETYEAKVEEYITKNPEIIKALTNPMPSSIAINDAIIEKLISHAQVTSRKISKEEISKLVIVGENIAKALAKHAQNAEGANKSPLPSIAGENGSLTIESNTYTTRALSWYMMASAAAQDVERQNLHGDSSTSDMVTFGSIIMKDPNNAIYNFLKKSNDAAPRTSTHFHDRAGHNNQHYYFSIIPSGQHSQWGIEDYEGLLPGHGGALLFDKLRVSEIDQCPELFIKFEAVGCPNWIDDATYNDNFHATSLAYSLAAGVSLNIQHALEFFSTRSSSHTENPNENVRQEHLYKGRLEELFSELGIGFDIAYKENIDLIKKDANEIPIASLMKKEGLPAAQREIERIEEIADKTSNADLKKKMQNLSSAIEKEIRNLGLVSDRHGIQRRGAEVHISLDAEKVGAALHKNWGNQGFQPDDASRSLMPADALAPDHIVDITPSHPPQRAPGSEALSVKV